jgi:hypothetical protein
MVREQVDFEQGASSHEPRPRSGGRPACRRGGRLAPRNPRFKVREQVDFELGPSPDPTSAATHLEDGTPWPPSRKAFLETRFICDFAANYKAPAP